MRHEHDSARERKRKNTADAEPFRGEFEATREAWIRWTNKSRLPSGAKLLGVHLLSIYSSRQVHNAERALVAWPKLDTLGDELDISLSQAGRRVETLLKQGYLSRWTGAVPRGERDERRGRPSAAYRFTMPPAVYFSHSWCEKLKGIFRILDANN